MRPLLDGDRKLGQSERGADVRGHVVGALDGVAVEAIVLGRDAAEELVQIVHDVGVGILLDGQRGGGVLDEDGQQTRGRLLPASHRSTRIGDFVQAFAARLDLKAMHPVDHPSIVCRRTERIGRRTVG